VLPDGSVDIVSGADGELFVAGPDTGPVRRELSSGSLIVGIRFRPGAAGAALGLPASELRDAQVPLEAIWGRRATELADRLAASADAGRKRRVLEEAVIERLPTVKPPDPVVLEAVRRLGRPRSRVGALSEALFVSERHLRRAFRYTVGYGPKTLDRVLRFQRFLSRAPAEEGLARVAAELGYADQAHLARESVRLSGLSPTRLAERSSS